jgi:hypothetical protein
VISHAFLGLMADLDRWLASGSHPLLLFPQFIEHWDNSRKPIQPTLGSAEKDCVRETKGKRRRSRLF